MEQSEISHHEVLVYAALCDHPDRWLSNADLAALVPSISPRTVRAKTAKFVSLGMVDVAEVFPAHRYRWSSKAKQRNASYLLRLEAASEVFA